jgi:adenine phosphoribosyltransferase
MLLANALKVPFIPVRKAGKLPAKTIVEEYALEYGAAQVEMHTDAIQEGWNVVIHDDLLATGGTAVAASKLVQRLGGNVISFLFLVELSFLEGRTNLLEYSTSINSLIKY